MVLSSFVLLVRVLDIGLASDRLRAGLRLGRRPLWGPVHAVLLLLDGLPCSRVGDVGLQRLALRHGRGRPLAALAGLV